jgi:CRISPR/Cas system-associated protein Cas10 (large subunit of type III CRISPR-Cas system)
MDWAALIAAAAERDELPVYLPGISPEFDNTAPDTCGWCGRTAEDGTSCALEAEPCGSYCLYHASEEVYHSSD